jgi:hypothetical protein
VPFQHYAQVPQRTRNPPLNMPEPLQKQPIEQVCSFLDNLQQDDKIAPLQIKLPPFKNAKIFCSFL